MYGTPAKMLLLADVDEYSLANAAVCDCNFFVFFFFRLHFKF